MILSFIIAGSVALLTGLCAAELSLFIHESAGSFIYAAKAFGPFPGFVVGWMKSFDCVVGARAVSIGFASYFACFAGIPAVPGTLVPIAGVWILLLTALNLHWLQEASWANNLLVAVKVLALLVFIAAGGSAILAFGDYGNYHPFLPHGITGVMPGAAIIFFAFIGFNTVAIMAEEVRDPGRTVPRAILSAFAVSTLIYFGVFVVAAGVVNWQILGSSAAPLEYALKTVTANILILQFVAVSAIVRNHVGHSGFGPGQLPGALLNSPAGSPPPHAFSTISARAVPARTILASGIAMSMIVLVTNGNLDWLASLFNFGTLLTFFFITLSLLQLRRIMPSERKDFSVPLYLFTPAAALIAVLYSPFGFHSMRSRQHLSSLRQVSWCNIPFGGRTLRIAPTGRIRGRDVSGTVTNGNS